MGLYRNLLRESLPLSGFAAVANPKPERLGFRV